MYTLYRMNTSSGEPPKYKYKKDDPEYYNNRKKKLCEQTKARYAANEETRERAKARAKQQYEEMKEALKIIRAKI